MKRTGFNIGARFMAQAEGCVKLAERSFEAQARIGIGNNGLTDEVLGVR